MPEAPLIKLTNLSRSFQRGSETIQALAGVTLEIAQGEFVALLGPSGSGKSTLMYLLGLLDRASSGSYELNGQDTTELNEDRRANLRNQLIGFVFQSFHLLSRASAQRNVSMPLSYANAYGLRLSSQEMQSRAKSVLELVGLGDRLDHLPNQLSGGQRQRVAIARALVNNPKLILADEPTGNLDSARGLEIIKLFEALNRKGVTVIVVTHDANVAQYAQRKIELRDGRIV
jgi:putative ABC transport system ATP-binding protein